MIYYPKGKYWLRQLLVPSVFVSESERESSCLHTPDILHVIVNVPLWGKKVILGSHQYKPKAGAADPVYHQNQALGLGGALPSLVLTGKYEQLLSNRA